jgi:transposase
MEDWISIRKRVLVGGVSKRQILRETKMHWKTLEKILAHDSPPGYRRSKAPIKRKIGPYLDRVTQIIEADKQMPKKQRHTAKRIWQRLREEGFDGGYTIVKDAVREIKKKDREVFVPLCHRPGEAQVDFGEAAVNLGGVFRKVAFFAMALPYSDAFFVMAFERECTESFWEGHMRAFEFLGGVPKRISYDNTKICISKITGSRSRKLTKGFDRLVSHYLFDHHFCLVRRPNEKGVVEGIIKYARLNFFVPVPQVRDFAKLNGCLLENCRNDQKRRLRGKSACKQQLLDEERAHFIALPPAPFDAFKPASSTVNTQLLVRFDDNDYSVPMEYAHHQVTIKGYVDRVEICYLDMIIAVHQRCWQKQKQIFEPLHYLPLLERKPGALDYARPLSDWKLPECFYVLRRRLEHEREKGTREYISVLQLLQKYPLSEVKHAVEKGLRVRAHTRDAIAQFLMPQEPWSQTTFTLDGHRHLRHVKVATCDIAQYRGLLTTGGMA